MNGQLLPLNEQGNGPITPLAGSSSSLPQTAPAASSESSIPRGSSLLERIRAQQEREAASRMENGTSSSHIEGYHPPMADGGAASPTLGRVSMDFDNDNDLRQGLLAGSTNAEDDYSMKEYFLTFVMDMYTLFRSLPILGQIVLIAVMLYLIWVLI